MNNSELKSRAVLWLNQGISTIRVTITRAQGSTPRPSGTFMLVSRDASLGTIGGGHLELEAITLARGLCMASSSTPVEQHFSLGPSLGQCCGGALDLRFEVVTPAMLDSWPQDALRFTLALFGAGHVGRAIAEAVALLPCQLVWIDEREEEFLRPDLPRPTIAKTKVEVRCVDTPGAEMKTLPTGCFVIITTHSHDLDLELCELALRRTDLGFIGLIGSGTKKARFLNRLAQKGVADLSRLVCPIGLGTILGKEPQIIAASVAAQLLELSSKA